eukprot:Lithocolla_globosa_v1_NODE_7167_length_984_cov_2.341227.p1 type:complete len:129 gc:universal NODE_7167_length_984_cov_2.341227:496-882(+)
MREWLSRVGQKAVEQALVFPGSLDLQTLQLQHQLGRLLRDMGRLNDAFQAEGRKQVLNANDPLVLQSLNSLTALHRLKGDYHNSTPLFQEILQARKEVLGTDDTETLTTMNSLALVFIQPIARSRWCG